MSSFLSLSWIVSTLFIVSQSCTVNEIIFSDDGLQLYVRFDSKVDTHNLIDNPSPCTDYFNAESQLLLSNASNCSFSSLLESNSATSTLLIDLSPTAIIQPTTESLTIVPNAFSCSSSSITLTVQPPANNPNTQIVIDSTVPTTIGSCDDFIISAYDSTGSYPKTLHTL